jgi:hypothetical protein
MSEQSDNWQYACDNFEAIQTALAEKDLVVAPDQTIKGPGVAQIFETPEDVAYMRVGRRHCKGHEDYLFRKSALLGMRQEQYSVFIPLTTENIDALLQGRQFQYRVAGNVQEDGCYVTGLDPESIKIYTGDPMDLVATMPKRQIPGVSSVDVKIGDSLTQGVKSSNPDDAGEVVIQSVSGISSVLYNPNLEEPPRPYIPRWGSFGWRDPLEVRVEGDKLFFDERQQPDGKLWLLKFGPGGYESISQ